MRESKLAAFNITVIIGVSGLKVLLSGDDVLWTGTCDCCVHDAVRSCSGCCRLAKRSGPRKFGRRVDGLRNVGGWPARISCSRSVRGSVIYEQTGGCGEVGRVLIVVSRVLVLQVGPEGAESSGGQPV